MTHSVQGNPLLCGWSTKRECPGDPPLPLTVDVKNTTQSKPFCFAVANAIQYHVISLHKYTWANVTHPFCLLVFLLLAIVFYNTTMHVNVAIDVISARVDGCHLVFENFVVSWSLQRRENWTRLEQCFGFNCLNEWVNEWMHECMNDGTLKVSRIIYCKWLEFFGVIWWC